MQKKNLLPLVIAGPTGSGKSALALMLARKHGGEIVCADSRQFYSHMSIGTAGPTDDEKSIVKHHGYGIVDPAHKKIDAGFFLDFAQRTIREIQERSMRPILVGGTGLYLRTLYFGLLDVPRSDPEVMAKIVERGKSEGFAHLHRELCEIDPEGSVTINGNDHYRIMRALEIFYVTGRKPSSLRQSFTNNKANLPAHYIYVKPDRDQLRKRIDTRIDRMFECGLLDEAQALRQRLSKDHWTLSVMGYCEALHYLDGKISLVEAKDLARFRHRQYAKRQFTWFNKETFYRHTINKN